MWKRALPIVLIICTLPAFAQNSITVTATRGVNAPPDLVQIAVDVTSPVDAGRDDVLAALKGSPITSANFAGVRTVQQFVPPGPPASLLDWTFVLTAPLGNFKATIAQLSALQQIVAQNKNGMSLSFSVQGTQVSPQAQQGTTCSTADLLSDARAQAQKMAAAADAGLGSVLAMSGASVTQAGSVAPFGAPLALPVCSLTVKFALTGF
jgi:hypothetical protein